MKNLILILTVILFVACNSRDEKQRIALQNLTKPVIVVGKYKPAKIADLEIEEGSITLRDKKGTVIVLDSRTYIGKSFISSYTVGDTIK